MGTVGYMSPEQAQGLAVDHRSDIFSLGCILYEATTGARPFSGSSAVDTLHKIIHVQPSPIVQLAPAAPTELQRIVRKCLAKSPEERYQSMKDVALDLRDLRREIDSGSASAIVSAPVGAGRRVRDPCSSERLSSWSSPSSRPPHGSGGPGGRRPQPRNSPSNESRAAATSSTRSSLATESTSRMSSRRSDVRLSGSDNERRTTASTGADGRRVLGNFVLCRCHVHLLRAEGSDRAARRALQHSDARRVRQSLADGH